MIAGLPMYDRPGTTQAIDRLWANIRRALTETGIDAPEKLTRGIDPWTLWRDPDLLLAQTCGLPYRTELHDRVTLVGTPVHTLPCDPGQYYSVIVAHGNDPRTVTDLNGCSVAVNEYRSQSGWAALATWAADAGLTFSAATLTGSHDASAQAVANGDADLAAIDAVTWAMILEWEGWAKDLRQVATTRPTPALPFITGPGKDPEPIFDALRVGIAGLSDTDRKTLRLSSVTRISTTDYLAVGAPPPPIG